MCRRHEFTGINSIKQVSISTRIQYSSPMQCPYKRATYLMPILSFYKTVAYLMLLNGALNKFYLALMHTDST